MSFMHSQFNPKKHSKFTPKNINKYIGKEYPICRSGLEKAFCELLDNNENVIEWSSEPLFINYMFQGKKKRYYPDFWVKLKGNFFGEEVWLVEIKPDKETRPPTKSKNKSRKTVLYEKVTWEKNLSKWKSAERYCNKLGWKWKVFTEKDLFKRFA